MHAGGFLFLDRTISWIFWFVWESKVKRIGNANVQSRINRFSLQVGFGLDCSLVKSNSQIHEKSHLSCIFLG